MSQGSGNRPTDPLPEFGSSRGHESGNFVDCPPCRRTGIYLAIPACDSRPRIKVDTGEIAAPQPPEMRDVGYGEFVASGKFSFAERAFEDRKDPFRLSLEPSDRQRYLLGRLPLEEPELSEGWTNPCQVKEHLLEDRARPAPSLGSSRPLFSAR